MSPGDPPARAPLPPDPDDDSGASGAMHPAARGDSIIATWGLLALGHVVEGSFGLWALGWGGLRDRYADPAPAVATLIVITVFGWTGAAVAVRMLRTAFDARQSLEGGRPPAHTWPPPLVLASLFVLFAVCAGVMAVFLWQAVGVLPAVGIELMQLPLAMRTERLLADAQGARPQ